MSRFGCSARLALALMVTATLACSKGESAPSPVEAQAFAGADMPSPAAPPPAAEEDSADMKAVAAPKAAMAPGARKKSAAAPKGDAAMDEAGGGASDDGSGGAAPAMRAWFPETFLFDPLVVTNEAGRAEVSVRMPDRLTSWRVLALAHSRAGAQGGAVRSIATTMPAYVDVVVPPMLYTGDDAFVAVQVVNTTDAPLSKALLVEAIGARLEGAPGSLAVPARTSRTAWVRLVAERPGTAVVRARYGDEDQVERTVPIAAAGRPREETRGGTLAAPRDVTVTLPPQVDIGSAKVRAVVVPGALGVLRGELLDAPTRERLDDVAYALSLVGRAPALATALGAAIDEDERRKASQRAVQRALRFARAPSDADAITLLRGAARVRDVALIDALVERLTAQVARAQRPDGTFLGGDGWQLSRLLVATADGVAALQAARDTTGGGPAAAGARVRAALAFERNAARVDDAYTAASILAAGAVEGAVKQQLVDIVRAAVQPATDGAMRVPVPPTAQRPDGSSPSELETTALAVLALFDDPKSSAMVNDLGAYVLGAYRPGAGFGDGRTNELALSAIATLFKDPLPQKIAVQLLVDGKPLAAGELQRGRDLAPLVLVGGIDERAGARKITIAADPPVPGLAFALAVSWSEPWPKNVDDGGLALEIDSPTSARLGRPVDIALRANAPGGAPMTIRHALPAGVAPDRAHLQALVSSRVLTSFRVEDGAVWLDAPARAQGQALSVTVRYVPSVAGRLAARPSGVRVAGRPLEVVVPTSPWSVAR